MYSVMLSDNPALQCLTNYSIKKMQGNCVSPRSSYCANHQVFNMSYYSKIFILLLNFGMLNSFMINMWSFYEANNERC